MIDAIAHHHDQGNTPNILKDCIFAANQISKQLQCGEGGNPIIESFPDSIVNRFGFQLVPLIEALGDLEPLKTEAQAFINP
jgi:hypothetical protein